MKKIQGNRTLRVRFRVRFLQVSFILFQTRPALTRDVTCSVTLLGWKRHEEAISDDNPRYYFSSFCINQSYYVCNCNHHCFHGCIIYCRSDFFLVPRTCMCVCMCMRVRVLKISETIHIILSVFRVVQNVSHAHIASCKKCDTIVIFIH